MLLKSRWSSRNNGLGGFTPLSVHKIGFFKFILEKPVSVGTRTPLSQLAPNHETFCVSAIPGTCFSTFIQKFLNLPKIPLNQKLGFLKTPCIRKVVNFRTRERRKLREIEIDAMKIYTSHIFVI